MMAAAVCSLIIIIRGFRPHNSTLADLTRSEVASRIVLLDRHRFLRSSAERRCIDRPTRLGVFGAEREL